MMYMVIIWKTKKTTGGLKEEIPSAREDIMQLLHPL